MTYEDSRFRTTLKTISWRITGTLSTIILVKIYSGNMKLALVVGGSEMVVKMVIYYVHERLWNRIAIGRVSAAKQSTKHPYPSIKLSQVVDVKGDQPM